MYSCVKLSKKISIKTLSLLNFFLHAPSHHRPLQQSTVGGGEGGGGKEREGEGDGEIGSGRRMAAGREKEGKGEGEGEKKGCGKEKMRLKGIWVFWE